jgi:hypothetical protein
MSTRTPTTSPLTRFWLSLERLPGPAAVSAEWRWLLRTDFELVSSLLSPDPGLATAFPRLGCPGEPYRVVEHEPDHIVGAGAEGEEPIRLTRADLVVYRLDPGRLVRVVAGALVVDPDGTPLEGLPATYRVGLYRPLAGFDFPVYLTIQLERRDYQGVVEALIARTPGPFLLLAPTNRHHRIASTLLLDGHNAAFLALADAIRAGGNGRWEASDAASAWLAEFRSRVLPAADTGGRVIFPTPPGARWADVRVRFVDGETVAVKVVAVTRTLTYAQMGMADGRSGKATKQWHLLRGFAQGAGTLTWKSPAADRRNQKRRENLAKDLKAFFRIDGEPIVLTSDQKGWRTVFSIEPD